MGGRFPRGRRVFVQTPPASFLRFPRVPTGVHVRSLTTAARRVDDSHMRETKWLLVNMKSACQQTATRPDFSGGAEERHEAGKVLKHLEDARNLC